MTAAEHRDETLTGNLLTVTIPGLLFSTPTPLRRAREVCERQREAGGEVRDDFLLRDGRLYSWLPPKETALASSVTGTTDAIGAADWAACPACAAALAGEVYQRPGAERARAIGRTAA